MASIQKMSSLGHRIYWRLYFPDGTFKEKYKASKSKAVLKEILPDIMKIESLSRRCELTSKDLIRALNLKIVNREEISRFSEQVGSIEDHYLSELRADFETQSKAQSPSMHAHMANLYKGDILEEHFKDIPISKITPEVIEAFRAKRKTTAANSTINQDLKALRKYLDIAVSKGWIKENPARNVTLLREPKSRIARCLYPNEVKIFFEDPYLTIKPDKPDIELRSKLFDFFVENCRDQELSDWLRDVGQDTQGTVEEKRARLRQTTTYLTTPIKEFPAETMVHLNVFPSEYLAGLCKVLGIDSGGTRDMRYRRIMREIGYREGWLSRLGSITDATFRLTTVQPYVEWYPIIKRGSYEKDFYQAFAEEMEDIFGGEFVHKQLPMAFGSTLKVDFHLGHPQREGVGVEFKMPTNNSEIQRALGQLDQYKQRYKDNLLFVLFPDFLDRARKILFRDQVSTKGIAVVVK